MESWPFCPNSGSKLTLIRAVPPFDAPLNETPPIEPIVAFPAVDESSNLSWVKSWISNFALPADELPEKEMSPAKLPLVMCAFPAVELSVKSIPKGPKAFTMSAFPAVNLS